MTTVAEVRLQLATIAASIQGWSGATYIGDKMTSGTIVIARPGFDPRMVHSESKREQTFIATAYASRSTPEASEAQLDALCELTGATSIIEAVQNGDNWTVDVDFAQVVFCGETKPVLFGIDPNAVEFLACPFEIKVVW